MQVSAMRLFAHYCWFEPRIAVALAFWDACKVAPSSPADAIIRELEREPFPYKPRSA